MQEAQTKTWYEDESFWKTFAPEMFNQERLDVTVEEIDQIIKILDIKKGAKILDLCCGIGRHSLELARRGYRIVGVDLTEEYLAKARKQAESEEYDFILIDNPPSLSMLTLNSLAASRFHIVPIGAGDAFALSGVRQLTRIIEMVRAANSDLQLLGALLTRFDGRLTICKTVSAQTRASFGAHNVFRIHIRNNTLVEQAVGLKQTVYELDGRAPAAADYLEMADEVLERCRRLAPEVPYGRSEEEARSSAG